MGRSSPVFSALFFLVLLAPLLSFAGQVTDRENPNGRAANPAWKDRTKYSECGQSCMYGKGNDVVSLEASYVINKLRNLKGLFADGKHDDEVRDALRTFCTDDEAIADCLNRYNLYETARLQKMGIAIGENGEAIYRLRDQNKEATIVQSGEKPNPNVLSQTPDILSVKEVEEELKTRDMSTAAFERYRKSSDIQPAETDFVQYTKKQVKGPEKTEEFLIRDPDSKAKQDAKAQFKSRMEQYKKEMSGTQVLTWKDVNDKDFKKREKQLKDKDPNNNKLKLIEEESYREARAQLIDTVNEEINKGSAKKGGLKGPAAGKAPAQPKTEAERALASDRDKDNEKKVITPRGNGTYSVHWDPKDLQTISGDEAQYRSEMQAIERAKQERDAAERAAQESAGDRQFELVPSP